MASVLLIGGHDSSGGAGLTVDQAVARDLSVRAWPVLSALTAQTDEAVRGVWPSAAEAVAVQIAGALAHRDVTAVKVGMLPTVEVSERVLRSLPPHLPVVLDPVLHASSGGALSSVRALLPWLERATLITPNLDEAAALGLLGEVPCPTLRTGGHGEGQALVDELVGGPEIRRWVRDRLPGQFRGTGCALATAIACGLAEGLDLVDAIEAAEHYLSARLLRATRVADGRYHLFGGP
jgi:hydroxymethylpyrimidine/phosphomethylpyrimidine kinase